MVQTYNNGDFQNMPLAKTAHGTVQQCSGPRFPLGFGEPGPGLGVVPNLVSLAHSSSETSAIAPLPWSTSPTAESQIGQQSLPIGSLVVSNLLRKPAASYELVFPASAGL